MPIWAFQKRIIGNPTPEKAAFVSSFADCDELFVINQRFPKLRMQVYGEFAPKLMDEDEIRAVIKEVLAELQIEQPTAKDKGRIMKTLMPRVKGKTDGGLVNQVLGGFFA